MINKTKIGFSSYCTHLTQHTSCNGHVIERLYKWLAIHNPKGFKVAADWDEYIRECYPHFNQLDGEDND